MGTIDILFLAPVTILIMVWSIGMPLAIRRAAREAKSKSVHEYSSHIEIAYKTFLNDPSDEEKLNIYERILRNQRIIRRIPTWPLSWAETFFVVLGSNLLLLAYAFWYVTMRMGYWPAVVSWFKTML